MQFINAVSKHKFILSTDNTQISLEFYEISQAKVLVNTKWVKTVKNNTPMLKLVSLDQL